MINIRVLLAPEAIPNRILIFESIDSALRRKVTFYTFLTLRILLKLAHFITCIFLTIMIENILTQKEMRANTCQKKLCTIILFYLFS